MPQLYSARTQSVMRIFNHLLYCLGQKATTFILEFTLYKVLSKSVVHLNKIKATIVFIILIIAGGKIIHNTYETTNKISFRTLKQHFEMKCQNTTTKNVTTTKTEILRQQFFFSFIRTFSVVFWLFFVLSMNNLKILKIQRTNAVKKHWNTRNIYTLVNFIILG